MSGGIIDMVQKLYKFDNERFINDLRSVNFENLTSVDDVSKAYSNFQSTFVDVIDKHIPMKQRRSIITPAPYMNKELRGAIYKKTNYNSKFLQNKSDANWEVYRK